MACCSGCAAPSQSANVEAATNKPAARSETVGISCEGENNEAGAVTDPVELNTQGSQELETAPLELAPASSATDDGAPSCKDKCCGPPAQSDGDKTPPSPPCCEGKPSPCCDASCLDRLALRACGDGNQELKSETSSESKCLSNILLLG
jgi:Cu2+-exporting ATPase